MTFSRGLQSRQLEQKLIGSCPHGHTCPSASGTTHAAEQHAGIQTVVV